MAKRLRVGIVGAGSIGCYVGGKLVAADAADVVFVGRNRLKEEIATHGLRVKDLDEADVPIRPERIVFVTEMERLRGCDAVLCCVKSAQTAEVAGELATILTPGTIVASFQNGVRNPEVLRSVLPRDQVIAAIVSFNVVARGSGLFHRGTTGPLMFEHSSQPNFPDLVQAMQSARVEVEVKKDLGPDQWTKLLVNLNNSVSALSGAPTVALLASPQYRRIIAALIEEALGVLLAANLRPAPLRGVPVAVMPFVLRLPTPLTRLVLRAQMRIDPESRSSMWEDLTRGRTTEVEFLNGEIVRLAETIGRQAPLNRRVVALIHEAERRGAGSPQLSAAQLWSQLQAP